MTDKANRMKQTELDFTAELIDVPLDTITINQATLNIEDKVRSNLFPWNGQFSPQLISTFLDEYSSSGDVVLDPFMGSGTVLVESARKELPAIGADINPAPFKIASAYHFCNVGSRRRKDLLSHVDDLLHSSLPDPFTLPRQDGLHASEQSLKNTLVSLADSEQGILSSTLLQSLIVLLDFYKSGLDDKRIFDCWHKLKGRITSLPYSRHRIRALNADSRSLPLDPQSVDLVVTSPPYINVFNYHQKYRASAEALGWNLLEVAKSEIGSNRKNRGNRFLTVIQYCLDITDCLLELSRVCKDDARIIFIVGRESNVRKTPFFNGDIVVKLATGCAELTAEARQERVFTNRFGVRIVEDILHFRNQGRPALPAASPRQIAIAALNCAKAYCPEESLPDLVDAIERVDMVARSPLYEPQNTHEGP